jgi:methylase of polypeptide subunit release factors
MLASTFDFSNYNTLCDIGGSGGNLSIHVAKNNPHMTCKSFDLPPVTPIANENITALGLSDRITAISGDFFEMIFQKLMSLLWEIFFMIGELKISSCSLQKHIMPYQKEVL